MPTKAQLVAYAQTVGVNADVSMLKVDIQAALRHAGYDPVTLTPIAAEPTTTEDPMPSALPTQFLPDTHPNDPTVTTLEQPDASVTPESIAAATEARNPTPAWVTGGASPAPGATNGNGNGTTQASGTTADTGTA